MIQEAEVERNPAEVYDALFVPALFAQWGPRVAAAAAIRKGDRVLDVGCGTGVLACAAAERVGPQGRVVGIDPNEQMLAVARRKPFRVVWQTGRAEALPFENSSFDAVVSQFAIMFFESRREALAEMLRVLRPGGRLAVAAFDSLERVPGYFALTGLLGELFGTDIARRMEAPFALGNRDELVCMLAEAGVRDPKVETLDGTVQFASIDAMVSTERACVWTLGGLLDESQFATLRRRAQSVLHPFVGSDGSVRFDCPAHVVTAVKS